ncbi:hypothetical protein C8J56DRAFT_925405 [Mycena floridula]|nr:hypothetical protein C8J56DRAFT_925405 [Mycena floridula]
MAVFSRLLAPLGTSYALQAVFALIFVPQQDERFYDLAGCLGFLSTTAVSLYYPALKAKFWHGIPGPLPALSTFAPRQLLASLALTIWSLRLGSFLAMRVIKAGGDSRFDEVKKQPKKFTYYWMAQATWVMLVGLPVYLCNVIPAHAHAPLGIRDYASFGLFAGSLIFEMVADYQKSVWRAKKERKEHEEKFITSGLWSLSRHPNYVGEVGLWTGIWALTATSIQTPYVPKVTLALTAVSPLFTYYLLRNLSGVPPLERAGNKKWGDDPKYQNYKKTVPVFWPWGGYD